MSGQSAKGGARHVDSVRDGYDAWAESYDTVDNPMIAIASIAREALAPTLAGARIVELGCGTGRNRDFFLAAGAREYLGIDDSEGMLARAKGRPADARARWLAADVRRGLPDEVRGFDVVFICLVLEHVAELAPIFRACAKAARPGGRLHVYELHAELHAEGTRAHFRAGDRDLHLPSYAHDAADYRRSLAETGWEPIRITDWLATTEATRASAKLAKHLGKPVLIDVAATSLRASRAA